MLGLLGAGAAFTFQHFGPLTGDSARYLRLAENLVAGHGLSASVEAPFEPEVFRPPGYPLFLALLLRLGFGVPGIVAVQVTLYALALGLICRLVYLSWGERACWPFGLLGVTYLPVVRWTTSITTEALTTFLVAFTTVAWASLLSAAGPRRLLPVIAGFGALFLTRTEYVLIAPLLVLFPGAEGRSRLVRRMTLAALLALVVLPWLARNYRATGSSSAALGVGGGMALWSNGLEIERGGPAAAEAMRYWEDPDLQPVHVGTDPRAAAAADERLRARGLDALARHPVRYAVAIAWRLFYRQWIEMSDARVPRPAAVLVTAYGSLLLGLAALGALTFRRGPLLPGLLMVATVALLHALLGSTEARYVAPVKPILFALAAGFVVTRLAARELPRQAMRSPTTIKRQPGQR